MKYAMTLYLGLGGLLGLAMQNTVVAVPAVAPAKFEPPDGTTYLGYYVPSYQTVAGFEKSLNKHAVEISDQPFCLLSMFIHAQEHGVWNTWSLDHTPDGAKATPAGRYLENVRAKGYTPVLAWTWMNYGDPEHSPDLKGVPLGQYDWYLDDWIAGIKKFKTPVFIRLSHEMNGRWFPYSQGYIKKPNAVMAEDYVKYWRYVVDRFRKAGVDNVAWVWCINGDHRGETPRKSYWPGDEYVDWLGIDVYSALQPHEELGRFIGEFGTSKPIMIPEVGTSKSLSKWNHKFNSNAEWTDELFEMIEEDYSPQIKGICWFEDFSTGSMVNDPAQLAVFRRHIAGSRYLAPFKP